MIERILAHLSPEQKSRLRSVDRRLRQIIIRKFRSFGIPELVQALRSLGVESGDALMVHSSFSSDSGFTGSPNEFIDALIEVIGPKGHLLMVSMSYMSSTYEYLQQGTVFDMRKTISYMGLLSESFRRRSGVLRSQHPTHPILALGPKANWLVGDHGKCLYPCGIGSPFSLARFL
jgi:aminoglycoside 3-N-acetyltransferase